MDEISNDQMLLFGNRKKMPLSVSDNSLDGIGTDLLSQEFLKAASNDNVLSQNDRQIGAETNFTDPLLIMNNDLTGQQHITLDDVADLDLATLVNADVGPQSPQESLGFNDFLSETSFCLNGLSTPVKLNGNANKMNFDNFTTLSPSSMNERGSKEFKIVPHYVDGKLTNTLQLAPVESESKLNSNRISVEIFPSVPNVASTQNDPNDRITATIEDFPSLSTMNPSRVKLTSGETPVSMNTEVEKIDVKPKEPKKLKRKKSTKIIRGGRKKKVKTTVSPSDTATNSNLTSKSVENKEPIKSSMPRFKIVHNASEISTMANVVSIAEPQKAAATATVETIATTAAPTAFRDGSIIGPLNATPTVNLPQNFNVQQPVDLILPVVSVRSVGSDKPILKPISELKAEDVCTVRRDPLKKLSKIQLQQIVNYLKQRKTEKISTSGPGSNDGSKIICKIMYPDEFLSKNHLHKPAPEPVTTMISIAKVEETANNVEECTAKLKKNKMRARESNYHEEEEYLPEITMAPSVTRSGRTSRPPKKLVKLNGPPTIVNDSKNEGNVEEPTSVNGSHPSASSETNGDSDKPQLVDGLPAAKKKKNTLKYCCPTCGKSYITNKGFLDHLTKFPLHAEKELTMKIQNELENDSKKGVNLDRKKKKCKCKCKSPEHCKARRFHLKQLVDMASEKEFINACSARFAKSTSLWDFFLLRIKSLYKFEDYVKGLLSELVKFVESLKTISGKILYMSHGSSETAVDIQDDTVAQIMGVAKGTYHTYPEGLNVKDSSTNAEMFFDKPASESTNFHQSSELDSLVHPDGKEDISQSSILSDILCDKTGMETVDQLVSERLKTLAPNDDILIDPPSDDLMNSLLDSVNAQSLSDAMFHSRVSSSTEDLLKALETLSSEIQPNHPPPTLDFTALSNEFNATER